MTNEVLEALRRLRNICSEASELVGALEWQLGHGAIEEEEPVAVETSAAPKKLVLEDVRAVLAELSRAGHTDNIRALLKKYGADRLSALDALHYADVLADAKELSNDAL